MERGRDSCLCSSSEGMAVDPRAPATRHHRHRTLSSTYSPDSDCGFVGVEGSGVVPVSLESRGARSELQTPLEHLGTFVVVFKTA